MADQTPIAALIDAIERNFTFEAGVLAQKALPDLRRIAQIEAERDQLRAQLRSATLEIAERSQEVAAAQAQVAALAGAILEAA